MSGDPLHSFSLYRLTPPYRSLEALTPASDYPLRYAGPGSSVVWQLAFGNWSEAFDVVRRRPPGMALVVILPPKVEVDATPRLLRVVETCRPHSILPFHPEPHLDDLTAVLMREPEDLPVELSDYLLWRGLYLDMDVRQLIRKIVEMSLNVRSVTALARGMYVSRRALGRRFLTRGLPVPSHWLHFFRIMRATLRIQNSDETLALAAHRFGYPDAFAFSNQMYRLTGVRPSDARMHYGWEWLVEAWLQTEVGSGGFSDDQARTLSDVRSVPRRRETGSGSTDRPAEHPPRPSRRPSSNWSKR